MKRLYSWLRTRIQTWYSPYIFFLLAVIEGFFIMPVGTLLTFFCLERRKQAFVFAGIATLATVFGTFIGYYIGSMLFSVIGIEKLSWFMSPDTFNLVVAKYQQYQAVAIFTTAFTPIPFKAITITAGFCHLPLLPVLFFSVIGRGLRFFLIAGAVYIWGAKVQYYIDTYFYYLLALFIAFLVFVMYFLH